MEHETLLKLWQHALRLDDWAIILNDNVLPSEMTNRDVVGEVNYQETIKTAVIRILNPICYDCSGLRHFDFEKTLLHELLHLKVALLCDNGNELQDRLIHQIIEDIAWAFVTMKKEYLKPEK